MLMLGIPVQVSDCTYVPAGNRTRSNCLEGNYPTNGPPEHGIDCVMNLGENFEYSVYSLIVTCSAVTPQPTISCAIMRNHVSILQPHPLLFRLYPMRKTSCSKTGSPPLRRTANQMDLSYDCSMNTAASERKHTSTPRKQDTAKQFPCSMVYYQLNSKIKTQLLLLDPNKGCPGPLQLTSTYRPCNP